MGGGEGMKMFIGYAGIGGESELWDDTNNEITHVEINPKIASILRARKPNRKVITGCAEEYFLSHYKEFGFVWLSPPCQSNSRMIRGGKNRKPRLPDFKLYEFLKFFEHNNYKGQYVIENVVPYFEPPIKPTAKIGRHLFWANFKISEDFELKQPKNFIMLGTVKGSEILKKWLGIYYEGNLYYNGNHDPCQALRNCVHPDLGLHVFNEMKLS